MQDQHHNQYRLWEVVAPTINACLKTQSQAAWCIAGACRRCCRSITSQCHKATWDFRNDHNNSPPPPTLHPITATNGTDVIKAVHASRVTKPHQQRSQAGYTPSCAALHHVLHSEHE